MSENEWTTPFPPDDVEASFRKEVKDCAYLVGEAIQIWHKSFHETAGPAALMFATGIEKLMKLALINDGFTDTTSLGHSLSRIILKMRERNILAKPAVFDDQVVVLFVDFLDEMSGRDRYRNVDHVLDPSKYKAPADVLASMLKIRLIVEGIPREMASHTLLEALFRWVQQISNSLVKDSDQLNLCDLLDPYVYGTFESFYGALENGIPPHRQSCLSGPPEKTEKIVR